MKRKDLSVFSGSIQRSYGSFGDSGGPARIPSMIGRENLKKVDAIILALMCKKLSQDDSQPKDVRETARKFKEEWITLQDSEPPQKTNGKQFGAIEKEVADIKARMIDFLAPIV